MRLFLAQSHEPLVPGRCDELWLERARAFALHALAQVERARALHGRGRFSLWTGDIGAAAFACQCLRVDPRLPTIGWW